MSELKVDKVSSRTGGYLALNTLSHRNLLINGDMSVAQRATSKTGITSTGYYTCDRWNTAVSAGTFTQSQSTDVPTGQGFASSLKMECTSAETPAAGDQLFINQRIEGQNLQCLKKGTSTAESVTISFWVKSNKTGTYICELYDNDNARQISKSYTIDSASSWEKKEITFAGDTTGAFDNNNGLSLYVVWWFGTGTNYSSGTLNTSWNSVTNANRAVGQVQLSDTVSNNFFMTGVQMEINTTATSYNFEPYDLNLQRCQRYCNAIMDYGDGDVVGNRLYNATYSTTAGFVRMAIPRMRLQPTLTYSVAGGAVDTDYGSADLIQLYDGSDTGWRIYDTICEAEL